MNLTPSNGRGPDAAEVKAATKGRWIEILVRAGIPEEHLDGKGHPCPKCGGEDRFAAFPDVNERGAVNCRVCETKCGDGLATLQWLFGCDFHEALRCAASCVGLAPDPGSWTPPVVRKIRSSYGAPGTPPASPRQAKGNQTRKRPQSVYGTPGDAEAAIRRREPTWRSNGAWDYLDADGKLLFTIVRFDLPELDEKGKPKKEFRPIVACEGGFKIGGVPKSGRPLYGLPSVKEAARVFVCEGEKACGALQRLGLVAVTSPFGAKSPEKTDWSPLAGKIVVVIPDNDDAGEVYLATVAAILAKLPDPPTLKVLRLPNLPEAGDAHDWLEELDSKEPNDLKRELLRMADEAKEYEAPVRVEMAAPPIAPTEKSFDAKLGDAAKVGLLGDYLGIVLPETESDESSVLAQAMTGIGNCLGRTVHFRVGADLHFANLFTIVVGKSARGRKGTSWGCARLLLGAVDPAWESNIGNGLSSGEGLIEEVRDAIPEGGDRRRSRGASTGGEAVVADPGVEDKRLLVVESEFGKVLASMRRDGNTLSPVLRMAWDGTPLRTMARSNRSRATGAHISIIGHIVEDELHSLLSAVDRWNGLANRCLWFRSERSKRLPFGGNLDLKAIDELSRRLTETMEFYRGRSVELDFHDDAKDLWEYSYVRLTRDRGGLLDAVTTRAEAQTRRIALIYAALDQSLYVRRTHLEAALAVWDYAEASAAHVFVRSTGNSKRDRLLAAIADRPGMTRTDLSGVLGRNYAATDLDALLGPMEEQKLVHKRRTSDGGVQQRERYYPGPPSIPA